MKKSLRASMKEKNADAQTCANDAGSDQPQGGVDSIINRYSGMSEAQLMQELFAATNRQKAEGRFDRDSIQKNVQTLLPMLDEGQKRKLFEILKRL